MCKNLKKMWVKFQQVGLGLPVFAAQQSALHKLTSNNKTIIGN